MGGIGCGRSGPKRVVLVTFDTLNVWYASPYNPEVSFTPNLQSFAENGVTFSHAYTHVPLTLPSHSGLMTGRRPSELGVMVNGHQLPNDATTLAEVFADEGFDTAAFVSLGVLKAEFNLAQGFATYDDGFGGELERWYRTADEVLQSVKHWLKEQPSEKFFTWVHFSDPHEPYLSKGSPPDVRLLADGVVVGEWLLESKETFRIQFDLAPGRHVLRWEPLRKARDDDSEHTSLVLRWKSVAGLAPYLEDDLDFSEEFWIGEGRELRLDNPGEHPVVVAIRFDGRLNSPPPSSVREQYELEVEYADRHLGLLRDLLVEKGLEEGTLWVLASDHGEGLFRHGVIGHATTAYEDQLRILAVLSGPNVPSGRVIDGPFLMEDFLPTILDLSGIESVDGVLGRSHVPCWVASCEDGRTWWSYGASSERQVITAVAGYSWPYKLLWSRRRRGGAFNLLADPREQRDALRYYRRRPAKTPPEIDKLRAQMADRNSALGELLVSLSNDTQLSPEQEDMLRSLGYLGD